MDRDHQQPKQSPRKTLQTSPHYHNNNNNNNNTIITTTNDRVKRDEWSEGAISSLLEAYEAKWTLRNRAKLKGQDWEDVARHVSSRANNSKSAKTQTQCKNKIESMKKRYRSESAAAAVDAPSWPLYSRLDVLLRGNGCAGGGGGGPPVVQVVANPPPVVATDTVLTPAAMPMALLPTAIPARSERQNSQGSNAKGADNNGGAKPSEQGSDKQPTDDDTESSTPQLNTINPKAPMKGTATTTKEENKCKKSITNKRMRRREEGYWAIGESIRWIAEAMVRSEEARMETMREMERMRAEAEEKRGEMELRRTEIIANTQLEIARLFAGGGSSADSSLGIGRS